RVNTATDEFAFTARLQVGERGAVKIYSFAKHSLKVDCRDHLGYRTCPHRGKHVVDVLHTVFVDDFLNSRDHVLAQVRVLVAQERILVRESLSKGYAEAPPGRVVRHV